MITTTRPTESPAPTVGLLMAFELGQRSWKLGFTVGMGQRPLSTGSCGRLMGQD